MSDTNVTNFGGFTNISGSAIGHNASVSQQGQPGLDVEREHGCDIGILTVIPTETEALQRILHLMPRPDRNGVLMGGNRIRVVAMQAREQGLEAAVIATTRLMREYRPRVVVLAGIGGGVHQAVRIGDVVVATQIFGYDLRRETPQGTDRRGQSWSAPQEMTAAVNAFFSERVITGGFPDFGVMYGPIGSGNAVIRDPASAVRTYLSRVNDKILAVDMEAAGLARCCHEDAPQPWVVVRGISDGANTDNSDDQQPTAAANAAAVVGALIPYLAR
jgi:adenosylhomocysteine nucleosidase